MERVDWSSKYAEITYASEEEVKGDYACWKSLWPDILSDERVSEKIV